MKSIHKIKKKKRSPLKKASPRGKLVLESNPLAYSVQFSRSVVSDSLRPHESQHTRPPCPSLTSRVQLNSCASSW